VPPEAYFVQPEAYFARGVALRERERSFPARHRVSLERGERSAVEVRIGMQSVQRELMVETSMSQEEVEAALTAAMAADGGVFILPDEKGGRVLVPAGKIAYVEVGGPDSRRVGFG
jgi:Protein of unknown function (DUF3107)